jgi:hypothetical protein
MGAVDMGEVADTWQAVDMGEVADTWPAVDMGEVADTWQAVDMGAVADTWQAVDMGAVADTWQAVDMGAVAGMSVLADTFGQRHVYLIPIEAPHFSRILEEVPRGTTNPPLQLSTVRQKWNGKRTPWL